MVTDTQKKNLDTALTNHSLHVKKKMLQNNRSRGPICPNCVANSGSATMLNQGRSWLNQGNRIRLIFSRFHELFPAWGLKKFSIIMKLSVIIEICFSSFEAGIQALNAK